MQTFRSLFVALLLTLGLTACSWQNAALPTGRSVAENSVAQPAGNNSEGYQLIYSFPGGAGGGNPGGGLAFVRGVAFATTTKGGDASCSCGVVFAAGKVIYTFKGFSSKDGANPTGDLLRVDKSLYGTTGRGGVDKCPVTKSQLPGCGTVFEIDTSGNERIVYRFKGGRDGVLPIGGLNYRNGVLYGITDMGGGIACSGTSTPGCGTIFAVDTSGHEKVIYRFKGGADGAYPITGLLAFNGAMYGTTVFGGGACGYGLGCGTVFRITSSGQESILHAFASGSDGAFPYGRLIAVNGHLYGTTLNGGCLRKCSSFGGFGTIFTLSVSGKETILHRFPHWFHGHQAGPQFPSGDLVFLNKQLFGTTSSGGCFSCEGAIYSATLKGAVKFLHLFNHGDVQAPEGLTLKPSTQELFGNARVGGSAGYGGIYRFSL